MTKGPALLLASLWLAPAAWATDAATHAARALQAWQAEDRDRALAEYQAALDMGGEDAAWRHDRALIFLERRDWTNAREEAQRAVALAPKDGRLLVTLAAAWMSGDAPDPKKARRLLKEAVRLLKFARDHVGLGKAHYNLGLLARGAGDLNGARREWEEALREDAANEDARGALALLTSPPR